MKESPTKTLAGFISKTSFDDLPKQVVHESKRLILDIIGCALGGYATDIGGIVVNLVRDIGGKPESNVIGSGDRTSCVNAAFANSKMANILDNDGMYFCRGGMHFVMSAVSASLSVCERAMGSGKDLITSVALGLDLAARIGASITTREEIVPKALAGQYPGASLNVTFAGVGGAAKALALDEEQMANAFGIASAFTPIDVATRKFYESPPERIPYVKYADTGWCAMAGVTAVLLAQKGFTGCETILDGNFGICRLSGSTLTKDLGEKWYILDIFYKRWPGCSITQFPMTIMDKIIKENNLTPEEIEKVVVHTRTIGGIPFFANQEPVGMMGCQFNFPHTLAMVAFGVKPGPKWFAKEIVEDPEVQKFRKKVCVESTEWQVERGAPALAPGVYTSPTSVEVIARGQTFSGSTSYAKGAPWTPETYFADEELKEKFREMALQSAIGQQNPQKQIEKIIEIVYNLEKVEDITELAELLSWTKQ